MHTSTGQYSLQHAQVTIGAILEKSFDAADRCRAHACGLDDFFVSLALVKHGCNLKTLCHGLNFSDCAEIFKETVTVLVILQGKDRIKKLVDGG